MKSMLNDLIVNPIAINMKEILINNLKDFNKKINFGNNLPAIILTSNITNNKISIRITSIF